MVKNTSVTLRMSAELKDGLQALAANVRRTLSNYIELVLEQHVDQMMTRERAYSEKLRVLRAAPHRQGKKHKSKTEPPKLNTEDDPIDEAIRVMRAANEPSQGTSRQRVKNR